VAGLCPVVLGSGTIVVSVVGGIVGAVGVFGKVVVVGDGTLLAPSLTLPS